MSDKPGYHERLKLDKVRYRLLFLVTRTFGFQIIPYGCPDYTVKFLCVLSYDIGAGQEKACRN